MREKKKLGRIREVAKPKGVKCGALARFGKARRRRALAAFQLSRYLVHVLVIRLQEGESLGTSDFFFYAKCVHAASSSYDCFSQHHLLLLLGH